jgi:hypothetical protein
MIFREKWSLFDESTHVPLLIYHPQSPFAGKRYPFPVELLDIFPTINDLVVATPYNPLELYAEVYDENATEVKWFHALQGKSLAPIILGSKLDVLKTDHHKSKPMLSRHVASIQPIAMPQLPMKSALSQMLRCASKESSREDPRLNKKILPSKWKPWDKRRPLRKDINETAFEIKEVSVMGYSLRTTNYRYTAYYNFPKSTRIPDFKSSLFSEELYHHLPETQLTSRETVNVAKDINFEKVLRIFRRRLKNILYNDTSFLAQHISPTEVISLTHKEYVGC